MLKESIDAVAEFHRAKGIDFKQRLMPLRNVNSAAGPMGEFPWVANAVCSMKESSKRLLGMFKTAFAHWKHDYGESHLGTIPPNNGMPDLRFLRASLILEEAAELIEALFEGDEIGVMDGSADLIYVVNGTAVSYNLPLSEAFAEVHRSNMSKAATGPRLQDKGASYSPPDLKQVLEDYRNACFQERRRSVLHGTEQSS